MKCMKEQRSAICLSVLVCESLKTTRLYNEGSSRTANERWFCVSVNWEHRGEFLQLQKNQISLKAL